MNQAKRIAEYSKVYMPKFNDDLFIRHDDDLINALKDIILSAQRDSTFTIKVLNFEVIDDYDEIHHILWMYQDNLINKGNGSRERGDTRNTSKSKNSSVNPYDYINLKDSDIKLLRVTYYIKIFETKNGLVDDTIQVYIAIPRIINKFYYRISGNIYSAMYQIADASTYNNANSKKEKKHDTVVFKTNFTATMRMYKFESSLTNIDGTSIPCTYFVTGAFSKTILAMKYLFAKFGYYGMAEFFRINIGVVRDNQLDKIPEDNYIFHVKDVLIYIPKYVYNNYVPAQCMVYTMYYTILRADWYNKYEDIFGIELWVKSLGAEFVAKNMDTIYDKGLSVLDSLEFAYDILTMKDTMLKYDDKADIYRIFRWIICDFHSLMEKDNLDISTKKLRYAEYIAALYAAKLAKGIYRISDKGDKAELATIRRAIQIPPMYLLKAIVKCKLVNYKGCANDLDALFALKYTYKGVGGIGEKANAIPEEYKSIHPSHLGNVDIDSSSPSDPGMNGTICPLTSLYNFHFTEFEEPSTWRERIDEVINNFRAMQAQKTMVELIQPVTINKAKANMLKSNVISDCNGIMVNLMKYISRAAKFESNDYGYDVFGDGTFLVTKEYVNDYED